MKTTFSKRFCSFTYLNITQFLGALNDNFFKFLIAFFLIDLQGSENSATIMSFTGAAIVAPFLLFSATAGKLADGFSKRNIIVYSKVMEVIVMSLGTFSFAIKSPVGCYITLFLMGLQSTLFSPSKYGIVPELVSSDRITKANGVLTAFSIVATISGGFLASAITDLSGKHFILSSSLCTTIAAIGLLASLQIEKTPAAGTKSKGPTFFIYEIYQTFQIARQHNRLFLALLGCSFFLFVGAFIQMNIVTFGIESLGLTEVQGGYLFLLTAFGIGAGSILAGKLSGPHVELGLVPIGGLGISITFFLLHNFSDNLYAVVPLLIVLGFFGGLFEVPLESYIQAVSPKKCRGKMIAAANSLGFLCVFAASGFVYANTNVLGLQACQGFTFMGIITLLGTLVFTIATPDYFIRFIAFSVTRICFRVTISNTNESKNDSPAIILCNRPSSWVDTLLLTAIQRPPLRFLVESTLHDKKLLTFLCRMMRIILIPSYSSPEQKSRIHHEASKSISEGYTVCLFTKSEELPKLENEKLFEEIQDSFTNEGHTIIPVRICEKPNQPPVRKMTNLLKKFPWHVTIGIGSEEQPLES
jgi:acyl-[acyl-carrier-protein]-phospholipid O-acyltransferase / long-chain-fatty-acid--[acyl-carrier-protein] ligase